MRRKLLLTLVFVLAAVPARAHIGSPDTFVQATAGPYKFLMDAHPPAVYPGALELDLRLDPADHITSVTVSLDGGQPVPVQIFDAGTATASIWLPNSAAHTLHISVQGNLYDLNLPASASPPPSKSRGPSVLWFLSMLTIGGLFFGFGLWAIGPRPQKPISRIQQSMLYLGLCFFIAFLLYAFVSALFHRSAPVQTTLTANLTPDGKLDLTLVNPSENFAELVPDDGKLMHLFLIRQSQQDVFLHLHPQQLAPGHFSVALPAMPPGTYQLFADYYLAPAGNLKDAHGETTTITLDLPAQFHPTSLNPDDTSAVLPPANAAVASFSAASQLVTTRSADANGLATYTAHLPDAYTLTLQAQATIQRQHANLFQVTLLNSSGQAPADMALYLNMPAHAVVVRSDNGVFAHIHPGGTLPMLGNSSNSMSMDSMPNIKMDDKDMPMPALSNTATIPYGFPGAGRYRIFIQMKHGPIVETAAFDLDVSPGN